MLFCFVDRKVAFDQCEVVVSAVLLYDFGVLILSVLFIYLSVYLSSIVYTNNNKKVVLHFFVSTYCAIALARDDAR